MPETSYASERRRGGIEPLLVPKPQDLKSCPSTSPSHSGSLNLEKDGVVMLSDLQRLLHYILVQCPVTASSAKFCLLCCQPEPIP